MRFFIPFLVVMCFSGLSFGQIDFEVINGDASICPGDSVFLLIDAPGIDSVRWGPANTLSSTSSLGTFASPTETTTYGATLFQFNQVEVVNVTVTVFELDLGEDITICQQNGPIELTFGQDYGPGVYNITTGGLNISPTGNGNTAILSPTASQPGQYQVIVNIIGCELSDTLGIEILPGQGPSIDFPEESISICFGESETLSVDIEPGLDYSWFAGGTMVSDTNSVTISPLVTTVYTVQVSGGSCSLPGTDDVTVFVAQPFLLNVPQSIVACQNDFVTIGENMSMDGVSYEWTGSDNFTDPTAPNVELFVTQSGTITLTASCLDPVDVVVNMIANDVNIVQEDQSICLGDQVTLSANVFPNGAPIEWNAIEDGSFSSTMNPLMVSPADVTTYVITASNGTCSHSDTVMVQVDSLPLPDLPFVADPQPACEGDTVQLTSTTFEEADFPNITFEWSPENMSDYETPDSLYNMVIIAQETKDYIRVTRNGACEETTVLEVIVIPTLEFENNTPEICQGDEVTINVIITQDGMVIDPDDLEWEWMDETLSCTDCPNPMASPSTTTTYAFMATLDDMCPLEGMITVSVTAPPMVQFPGSEACPGDNVLLNGLGGAGNEVFTWASDPFDPSLDTSAPQPSIIVQTVPVTYSVTVTDGVCPPLMASHTITPHPPVSLDNIEGVTICQGESVTLTANGNPGGGSYTWTSAGTVVDFGPNIEVRPGNSTSYMVTYEDQFGCNSASTITSVEVLSVPLNLAIVAEPDTVCYNQGEEVSLTLEGSNIADVSWSDANGFNFGNANPVNLTVSPIDGGETNTYTVEVTSADGCTVQGPSITLVIKPAEVLYPTVFTPGASGGDPQNRIFNVVRRGQVDVIDLRIYDRWGNLVYDNENNNVGWDGTINDTDCPTDVYIYIVTTQKPGEEPVVEKGEVTLLR